MGASSGNPRIVIVIRWIARIWSILVFAVALMVVVVPDPCAAGGEPVRLAEWIVLGFLGVAVLGLLLAWRWEGLGGTTAVVAVLAHLVGFRVVNGGWPPDAAGVAVPGILFALPGVLYLVCWVLSSASRRRGNEAAAAARTRRKAGYS